MADRDYRAAVFAAIGAAALMGQVVAGKATRDALFLSVFPISALPRMMIASAVFSIAAVPAFSWALARYTPARVVPLVFAINTPLLAMLYLLSTHRPATCAIALALHMALFSSAVASSFWSLVNERFDPHTAKQVVGWVTGGGTLGAVAGGVVAGRIAHLTSVATMLLVMAVTNLVCVAAMMHVRPRPTSPRQESRPPPASHDANRAGIGPLVERPYLFALAMLVLVGAFSQALLDYLLSSHAAQAFGRGAALMSFLAMFHAAVGVLSFGVQLTLSRVSLERIGLTATVAVAPVAIIVAAIAGLLLPPLGLAVLLRGTDAVMRASFFRAGYELLFTPLPESTKRSTKAIVDVGFDRLGTMLGSGLLIGVLELTQHHEVGVLVGIVVLASVAAVALSPHLHQGYVSALEASLRSGTVAIEQAEVVDATTLQTLSETIEAMDRRTLLQRIEALHPAEVAPSRSRPSTSSQAAARDALTASIVALRDPNTRNVPELLDDPALLDPSVVPHVIPLLASDIFAGPALRYLRKMVSSTAGALTDALLDPRQPHNVRRRLPRVFRDTDSVRAVEGLVHGLSDANFDVRNQCAAVLVRTIEKHPELGVPHQLSRERVFELAARELGLGRRAWDAKQKRLGLDNPSDTSRGPMSDSVQDDDVETVFYCAQLEGREDLGLQHVFTLLALVLDRGVLALTYRALNTEDSMLKGTALEYLEIVLPEPVRQTLWAYLGAREQAREVRRRADEVEAALLASQARIDESLRLSLLRARAGYTK